MANCEFYASIYAGSLEMSLGSDETSNRLADSLEEALPEFYAAVLVFAIKARSYFDPSSRAEQFFRALKPFSTELRPYFTDISEKESRMKELAHMATMEGIKGLRNMHMIVGELKSQLSQITDDHALKWLKATDPAPLFDRNREHRLEGTCEWIMDDENYKSWMAGTGSPNLWVVGIPGAGKSVLSANLVEQVQAMDQVTLLYFFFRDGDNKTTSPLEMAASIVAQLMNTGIERAALMGVVKTSVEAGICFEGGGRDFKRLWAIFVDMLRIYPTKVIVILDAMDECGDCGIVSRSVLQRSLRETGVRFLLTGRPEVHHHFHFHPEVSTIRMNVNDDISKFITEKVADNENLRRHKDKIIATVYENSAGMFRYAALVLEELNLYSTRKISERLQTMPKGITGMYELILRRLCSNGNEEEMHMRRRILHWVAMAERPFSVAEMQYACATVDGEKSFDPDVVILPSQQLILQSCGSLLEIFDGDKLRFTHRTVKEFLLHSPEQLSPDSLQDERLLSCLVTEPETHATMARTCVTQLFSKRFPLKGDEAKKSPFAYAVEFWIHHAKKVPQGKNATSVSEDLWNLVAEFLWSGSTAFDRWINVHPTEIGGRFDEFWDYNLDPLHVAAAFDLVDILDYAHPEKVDFKVLDKLNATVFFWAVYGGAKRAVALLLDREDVNANAADKYGLTPLMGAAFQGHGTIVELLLRVKDIDINAEDNVSTTALDYASNEDIKKLLRQLGALYSHELPEQGDDIEPSGDKDESKQIAEED